MNFNLMNQQKQNIHKTSTVKQPIAAKNPYTIKVLEDALKKNEQELHIWKTHVRKFSWMRYGKESPIETFFDVVIAYKDGFGNEFLSETFPLQEFPEKLKSNFMKSITHHQAEGNIGPCESRISQIKEVISILKQS